MTEMTNSYGHKFITQDASNKADLVIRTAQEVSSKRMDEWLLSTEALGAKKMELEIESHIISKARTVLDTTIEDSVEDDKQERESLCKKRDVLTDELQKLLLLVKQKEQEIAETECNIEAVDKRITDVVSGFQEMQSNLDSKIGNLQSGLSNIDFESEALSTKKKEIDELLTQEEEKGAKLRELANASAAEAKTYEEVVRLRKNLMVSVLKSREDKVRLAKTEEKLSDDVQMLQQVISSSRASLQVSFQFSLSSRTFTQILVLFLYLLYFIPEKAGKNELMWNEDYIGDKVSIPVLIPHAQNSSFVFFFFEDYLSTTDSDVLQYILYMFVACIGNMIFR